MFPAGLSLRKLLAAWLAMLVAIAGVPVLAGKLGQARYSVRPPPPAQSSSDAEDDDDDDDDKKAKKGKRRKKKRKHCDDDDSLVLQMDADDFVTAVTSPFWIPARIARDDYIHTGYFPAHPYQGHSRGFMMIEPWVPEPPNMWSAQATVEYATDFSDLSRVGGQILFEISQRLGIDSEWNLWYEDLPTGRDELATGDVNLVFRFAQSQRMQMRSGIGLNWMTDSGGSDTGFNFTYGGDWYPGDPWIFSAEIDIGKLGRASTFHGRATTGWQYEGAEIYAGYDFLRIGEAHLHGIIAGFRAWF